MVQFRKEQSVLLRAYWSSITYTASLGDSTTNIATSTLHSASVTSTSGGDANNTTPIRGIVTTTPFNLVSLRDADSGLSLIDSNGAVIFGRITFNGSNYVVSYLALSDNGVGGTDGTEVSTTLPNDVDVKMLFPEVMKLSEVPVSASLVALNDKSFGGSGGGSSECNCTSDDVSNESTISGASVTDALDEIDSQLLDKADRFHAGTHLLGGLDEIDGDHLDIDYTPFNYTPTIGVIGTNVDHLAAHLRGLDVAVASAGGIGGESLSETLAIGNWTGSNNILIDDNKGIEGRTDGSDFFIRTKDGYAIDSGDITMRTGDGDNSGDISIYSYGASSVTGNTGNINIYSGGECGSNSGFINIHSGDSPDVDSGNVSIYSGGNAGGDSGNVSIYSGSSNNGLSGNITLETGIGLSGSGNVELQTGSGSDTVTTSGEIYLHTGSDVTESSGDIHLHTGGDNIGNVGNIELRTGMKAKSLAPSAGTPGDIVLAADGYIKLQANGGDIFNWPTVDNLDYLMSTDGSGNLQFVARKIQVDVFDTPGSDVWTIPNFSVCHKIIVIGGGGNGGDGGTASGTSGAGGGGGGGAGIVRELFFNSNIMPPTLNIIVGDVGEDSSIEYTNFICLAEAGSDGYDGYVTGGMGGIGGAPESYGNVPGATGGIQTFGAAGGNGGDGGSDAAGNSGNHGSYNNYSKPGTGGSGGAANNAGQGATVACGWGAGGGGGGGGAYVTGGGGGGGAGGAGWGSAIIASSGNSGSGTLGGIGGVGAQGVVIIISWIQEVT